MSRRLGVFAALLALVFAGSLEAATNADPIIGSWRVTKGGTGTFTIKPRAGVLAFDTTLRVRLGCINSGKGTVLGFAELPSRTKLPKGTYNGNLGVAGSGCYYNVRLTLKGRTLTGRVLYRENDNPGGPFTFTKVR